MRIVYTIVLALLLSPAHAAEITGHVKIKGSDEKHIGVGFIAKKNNQPFNCGCSAQIGGSVDEGSVSCLTFKPYTTILSWSPESGCTFQHKGLTPGRYFVYVKWDDLFVNWKVVQIKTASDVVKLDLEVSAYHAGAAKITVADKSREYKLRFAPVDAQGQSPFPGVDLAFWLGLDATVSGGSALIPSMYEGDYEMHVARIQRLNDASVFSDVGTYRITVKARRQRTYTIPLK